MTEDAQQARIVLTAGELDVMRKLFDNRRWPSTTVTFTHHGLRMLDKQIMDLSRWTVLGTPGMNSFNHEVAYQIELLERIRGRVASALDAVVL